MSTSYRTVRLAGVVSAVFAAAIFGFFYAWICSTMWGLDNADPRVAIAAMQAMNASVRNAVFFPAFFATPVVIALAAGLAWRSGLRRCAGLWAVAAVVYLLGGLLLTVTLNVPMNESLATVRVPADLLSAQAIWEDYSGEWQVYNAIRTVASGLCVVLVSMGLLRTGSAYASDAQGERSQSQGAGSATAGGPI